MIQAFCWVLHFINDCRNTPNLRKDPSIYETVNSEKCLIRFIRKSYLSDLKIADCLIVKTLLD